MTTDHDTDTDDGQDHDGQAEETGDGQRHSTAPAVTADHRRWPRISPPTGA